MNTPYKHKNILSNNAFVFEEDNIYCVWQNEYNSDDNRVDIYLDFFEKTADNNYYAVKEFAKGTGFEYLESFDEFSDNKANEQSERILYVFKK